MKIVLIGDSIREGYDRYVKQAFDGVAMVCYPPENCRFTTYIIRNLIEWIIYNCLIQEKAAPSHRSYCSNIIHYQFSNLF